MNEKGLQSGTLPSTDTMNKSNDPRFQRRIPQEFYLKEEAKFKPLPSNWEIGTHNGRKYFVNHKSKTTTWIDPRTKLTRTQDLEKVKVGELPYGWEEAVDPSFGVYYINHIIQANYPDPPWDSVVREQALELQKFVDDQIIKTEKELLELEKAEQDKIDAATRRVEELEAEKIRIEAELLQLRQQALADVEISESESEMESDVSSILSVSTTMSEKELEENLKEIEAEIKKIKPADVPQTKEEFQKRLRDLLELNQKLSMGGPGFDGVSEYKKTEEELKQVSEMLKKEAESREILEDQIAALKRDMEQLYNQEPDDVRPYEEEEEEEEPEFKLPGQNVSLDALPLKANLTRKTRYEMELELLNLKKKLMSEKLEKQRLAGLKSQIDATTENTGKMPVWIKQVNDVAASSKTLRVKIGQKQASAPDALSFRERMLFFAAGKTDVPPATTAKKR